jgi:hypothetical protein
VFTFMRLLTSRGRGEIVKVEQARDSRLALSYYIPMGCTAQYLHGVIHENRVTAGVKAQSQVESERSHTQHKSHSSHILSVSGKPHEKLASHKKSHEHEAGS